MGWMLNDICGWKRTQGVQSLNYSVFEVTGFSLFESAESTRETEPLWMGLRPVRVLRESAKRSKFHIKSLFFYLLAGQSSAIPALLSLVGAHLVYELRP